MKYFDISKTISSGMKVYPSDPGVEIYSFKSIKQGDSCNLNKLILGSHSGTHIDAPRHILPKAKTVDKIKINNFICKALVVNCSDADKGTFIKKIKNRNIKGVLLKGKQKEALSYTSAMKLVKNGIRVIGTEEMSIENTHIRPKSIHRLLLKNGVVIVENLILRNIKPGLYTFICLPLKIKNGDGSPTRAILIHD